MEIEKLENRKHMELTLLADMITKRPVARQHCNTYLICDEVFTDLDRAAAWRALYDADTNDEVVLQNLAIEKLKWNREDTQENRDKINELVNSASYTMVQVESNIHSLAVVLYRKRARSAFETAMTNYPGDAGGTKNAIFDLINSVPQPPPLGVVAQRDLSDFGIKSIPHELMHVPGFIDEMVEYSKATALMPSHTLSFAGALSLLGHMMGRIYTDANGKTFSNLIVIALASSGAGKSQPRNVNRKLTDYSPFRGTLDDTPVSGEAIEECLFYNPKILFQIDEIQSMFSTMKKQATNPNAQSIQRYLCSLFTESGNVHTMRGKATEAGKRREIFHPSLSVFGTGITKGLFYAMTPDELTNGLLGRCLIFVADDNDIAHHVDITKSKDVQVPARVENTIQELGNLHKNTRVLDEPNYIKIPYGEGAVEKLNYYMNQALANRDAYERDSDDVGAALWGRISEKVAKLAMIYAVSESYAEPKITVAGLDWAWSLSTAVVNQMIGYARRLSGGGKYEENINKTEAMLKKNKAGAHECTRRDAMRLNRDLDVHDIEEMEKIMVERGIITVTAVGKNSYVYKLRED